MKVISFCLWGDNPKYTIGAIRNADLAREIYPGWTARFYCAESVPDDIRIGLLQHGDGWKMIEFKEGVFCKWASGDGLTEIVFTPGDGDWRMMLDRFRPIEEPKVEVMISRDCDSRLSKREKDAVDEWLASDKSFHTMHDHPYHSVPVLGGMFGIKKGLFSEMSRHAVTWAESHEARWQCDQDFLKEVVWPVVQHDTLNHDEFYRHIWGGKPFPSPRSGLEFVGQVFDENECTVPEHLTALAKAL